MTLLENTEEPVITFYKTHPDAKLPCSTHNDPKTGDSGFDVYAVECCELPADSSIIVPVGLKVAYVTPGYWFRVEARSGLGFKHSIFPHYGIFDNAYRGSAGIKLYNLSDVSYHISKGDRIAQLVVYELIRPNIEWAEEIQDTQRGEKGFGSSGK